MAKDDALHEKSLVKAPVKRLHGQLPQINHTPQEPIKTYEKVQNLVNKSGFNLNEMDNK